MPVAAAFVWTGVLASGKAPTAMLGSDAYTASLTGTLPSVGPSSFLKRKDVPYHYLKARDAARLNDDVHACWLAVDATASALRLRRKADKDLASLLKCAPSSADYVSSSRLVLTERVGVSHCETRSSMKGAFIKGLGLW